MEYYEEKLEKVNQQIELAKIGFMVKFEKLTFANDYTEFYESFKQIESYIKAVEELEDNKKYYINLIKE